MKKVAFVVEGQTELIFVQKFIEQLVPSKAYTLHFAKVSSGVVKAEGKRNTSTEEEASLHILIINAQGDDQVQSVIADYAAPMKKQGYTAIYGLRDRFSGDKRKTKVNPEKIDEANKALEESLGITVETTVALEEIEAWFLAVPCFFEKIHADLSVEKVCEILKVDLKEVAVEAIDHPARDIDKVFRTVDLAYTKRAADSHRIASHLNYEQLYLEKSQAITALGKFVGHLDAALA